MEALLPDQDVADMEHAFPPLAFLGVLSKINSALALMYLVVGVCLVSSCIDTAHLELWIFGDIENHAMERWFIFAWSGAWLVDSVKGHFAVKVARSRELRLLLRDFADIETFWRTDEPYVTYLLRSEIFVNGGAPLVIWMITGSLNAAIFFGPFALHAAIGSCTNHFKAGLLKMMHAHINEAVLMMLPGVHRAREVVADRRGDQRALRQLLEAAAVQGGDSPLAINWDSLIMHTLTLHRNLELLMAQGIGASACLIFLPGVTSAMALGVYFVVMACVLSNNVLAIVAILLAGVYSIFALGNLKDMAGVTSRFCNTSLSCSSGAPIIGTALHLLVSTTSPEGCDRLMRVMQIAQPSLTVQGIPITNSLITYLLGALLSHVPVLVGFARALFWHTH